MLLSLVSSLIQGLPLSTGGLHRALSDADGLSVPQDAACGSLVLCQQSLLAPALARPPSPASVHPPADAWHFSSHDLSRSRLMSALRHWEQRLEKSGSWFLCAKLAVLT